MEFKKLNKTKAKSILQNNYSFKIISWQKSMGNQEERLFKAKTADIKLLRYRHVKSCTRTDMIRNYKVRRELEIV
jgi:hypothetical protein